MRYNLPLGRLTPEELLVHRELEYLRVAGRRYRRQRRNTGARWRKLQAARRRSLSSSAPNRAEYGNRYPEREA